MHRSAFHPSSAGLALLLFSFCCGEETQAATCPSPTFVATGTFAAGLSPAFVAVGDFNRDGVPDLAVANEFSANVSVLLGRGDGTFLSAVNYGVESAPSSVAVGDFNGDSKLDLAVANAGRADVSVLLGNGDGTFQTAVGYAVGDIARSVAVGDFNGDGRLDLAVANRASATVSVLLGLGDGTFQTAVDYNVGPDPLSVAVGDFNRDGTLDLAVANAALFGDVPSVSVLLGRGNGTFRNALSYGAGMSPRSLTVGDFNRDGQPDLAVANYGDYVGSQFTNSSVSVLLGQGDGSFQSPINYRAGDGPVSLVTADLDGDGWLDLAVVNDRSRNLSVLLGNGDGTFQAPVNYGAGPNPRSVAAGDFSGDGEPDLGVANDGGVLVLLHGCLTNADLTIGKIDMPDPVAVGSTLSYALSVTNTGPAAAPDASVTDRLPAGVSFVSVTTTQGSCTNDGGTINCTLGNMNNGATATITIMVTPIAAGRATNTATVSSSLTTDPNSANNTATAVATVLPVVNIFAADPSASEAGADPGMFTVRRTGGANGALTVKYTLSGSASNGADYAALAGAVTIPDGSVSATITVTPVDDLIVEPTETVIATLAPDPTYFIEASSNRATVAILDNDVYALSINDVTVSEGNDGITAAVFTVTLWPPNNEAVTVNVSTADGSASAGSDYVPTSGLLSFAPGATNQSVTVTVLGDQLNEANETFFVTLSDATNAVITNGQGKGTIANDDPLPELTIDDVAVTEGDSGSINAVFTVSLSAASGRTVTARFASADGTASAGSDYVATNGLLSFAPGTTNQSVTVTVLGDQLNEADETFFVTLSDATNAVVTNGQGMGTIANDDPLPGLSVNDMTVTEGDSGSIHAVFTVSLSAASGQTVTARFASVDGTARAGSDYMATNGLLSFAPGTTNQSIAVAVIGDVLNEANETFFVTLSDPTNAVILFGLGTGTIGNDDPLPELSVNDVSVMEGDNGSTNAVFTVRLSAASGQTVTVRFATGDGTARAGSDYFATNGLLSFAPGTTNQSIAVTVLGDVLNEANETFFVTLSDPTNAVITNGQGRGTIANDDPLPGLSVNDVTVTEGDSGSVNAVFTVSLSAASGQSVTVRFASVDGTARAGSDYMATNGLLSFAPGTTNQNVVVAVLGDVLNEANETFFVTLSDPTNAVILDGQGIGTIANDDPLPGLSVNDVTVTEGDSGSVNAVFTVSLSAASGQTVTVRLASVDGTARGGSDYVATNGVLSLAPGTTNQSFAVTVLGDVLNEANETFFVTLADPTNAVILDGQGTGTIENDDPVVSISISDAAVFEGNSGSTNNAVFTVRLSAVSGQLVTVNYATANGTTVGNDYTALSGTLSFSPGQTDQVISIPIKGDTRVEDNETFFVNLSNPVNATFADSQGVGTILNDDGVPSISITDSSVGEGNSGITNALFAVRLSATSAQVVTVSYATADDTATAGTDYLSTNGVVTFAPGTINQIITVPVIGDRLHEADERFVVNLFSSTNALISAGQGVGTILDDDPLNLVLSTGLVYVAEGATNFFSVQLSASPASNVIVATERTDGSTNLNVSRGRALTFTPGNWNVSQMVALNASEDEDTTDEHATFTVSSAGLASQSVAATGLDNDLQSLIRCLGDNATFSTVPSGNGPFRYIWRKDGALLAGQTNSTLLLSNVASGDAGAYSVEVTCDAYTVMKIGRLVVNGNTSLTPLISLTNCPGTRATFSTVASGGGPFGFVWRKDGALLTGQTSSTLEITNVMPSDAGLYSLEVTGACGTASASATLAIGASGSCLRITTIALTGGDVVIRFYSLANEHYRLERTEDLAGNLWTAVVDDIPGTGGLLQVADVGGVGHASRFYRLALLPGNRPPRP